MERVENENGPQEDLAFEIVDARNEQNRYSGTMKVSPYADRVQLGAQLVRWHAYKMMEVTPPAKGSMDLSFLRVQLGDAEPALFASLMMPNEAADRDQHEAECPAGMPYVVRVRPATESDRDLALSMLHSVPRQATGALILLGFGEPLHRPSSGLD